MRPVPSLRRRIPSRPSAASLALGLACAVLAGGCSSVPDGGQAAAEAALLSDPPRQFLDQIELAFRKKVAFIDDAGIVGYLQKLSARVFPPGPTPIGIEVISTLAAGYEPSVWVIPGGKIFVDVRVLRALQFENEIAAALSFAWDRSEGPEFRERLIAEAAKANPDPTRIWVFSDVENQRAIEASVERLYKAGYDPRGLVSCFDRLPSKNRGLMESETETMKEKARRAIAFYAPLLNPIVRTEDFYKMRKRLERL